MSVNDCLEAYRKLADNVIQAKNMHIKWDFYTLPWNWQLQGRFDSKALENAIKALVMEEQ